MMLIKLIAIGILAVIVLNGFQLMRFFKEIRRNVRMFKEQMNAYQQRQGGADGDRVSDTQSPQQRKKIIPQDEGEYVEYEEVEE